jgi:hypothetical protein
MPNAVSQLTDEFGIYGYRAGQAAGSFLVASDDWPMEGSWVVYGDDPECAALRFLIGIEDNDPDVTDSLPSSADDDAVDVLVNVLAEFGLSEEDAGWEECGDWFGAGYTQGVLDEVVRAANALID